MPDADLDSDEEAIAQDDLRHQRRMADIAWPLSEGDPLISLLKMDRMKATVIEWLRERASDLYDVVEGEEDSPRPTPQPQRKEIINQFDRLCADATVWWPVRIGPRQLGLVIRQWAEEEPDAVLARKLAKDETWAEELVAGAPIYAGWRDFFPTRGVGDWVEGRDWYRGADCGAQAYFSKRLRQRGLPSTPSTVRYLRASIVGEATHLPARGVLVTTLAYVDTRRAISSGPPHAENFLTPPHDMDIAGVSEWTTGALIARAHRLLTAHRQFLHSYRDYPLANLQMTRQIQALLRADKEEHGGEWFDYETEAMRAIDGGDFDWHGTDPRASEASITAFLAKIQNRVKERRKEHGKPLTPPDGWQDAPRDRMRKIVEIRLTERKRTADL